MKTVNYWEIVLHLRDIPKGLESPLTRKDIREVFQRRVSLDAGVTLKVIKIDRDEKRSLPKGRKENYRAESGRTRP